MEHLGATEYGITAKFIDGPICARHIVRSQSTGAELLADLAAPDEDEYLSALCHNASRTRRCTEDPAVANVLEAGWQPDGKYFQVLEMSPRAQRLSDGLVGLSERRLWAVMHSLTGSLRHLHRRELVHAAIAPACIYQDGGKLRLAELWFVHNADGDPLHGGLSKYFPARVPDFALPFMAPEVLLGDPPVRESDIFSLGGVLFFLLTGEPPRELAPPYPDLVAREALARAPVKSLSDLSPCISEELEGIILGMLTVEPDERPTIFELAAVCDEAAGGTLAR